MNIITDETMKATVKDWHATYIIRNQYYVDETSLNIWKIYQQVNLLPSLIV